MLFRKSLAGAALAVFVGVGAALAGAGSAIAQNVPEAMHFARRPAISSVDLSPDGRHLAAVVSPDGTRRHVSIWQTDNFDAAPFNIGTDERSELVSVRFVSNDRIFVTTQQPFVTGNLRTFVSRTQLLRLDGTPVTTSLSYPEAGQFEPFVGLGNLVSTLPLEEDFILVGSPRPGGDTYRFNIRNGTYERYQRGSDRWSNFRDARGEIRGRVRADFESGAAFRSIEILHPDTGAFEEHFRVYARDRGGAIGIAGFSTDPNIIFIYQTSEGRDNSAVYEYDIRQRRIGEVAFAHPVFDAAGIIQSTYAEDFGEILGFRYAGERTKTFWVDPAIEDAVDQIRAALAPDRRVLRWQGIADGRTYNLETDAGADVSLVAWSRDRRRLVVRRSGFRTPPEYHVLIDGRLRLLGRAYPELAGNSALGDAEVIQYPARDGLQIPAIVYRPNAEIYGPGPYPAIIVPHGGPWARDDSDWDTTGWSQYFVSRGYTVIMPQFRGSLGWGDRLWIAGDGQWGRTMQDDKDDAARWLIAQGLADPDRIAMHGYSYGGYSAMMAAVRPSGLYRCAAAGAGPSTLDMARRETYDNRWVREVQHPAIDGEDPLRLAAHANIPLYLYSGDRDNVVNPNDSRRMASALRANGSFVRLEILPVMDHTLNTWTPANFAAILTTVEDFFQNQCGPGGSGSL
ncbi:MAG: alpha/beta hydrolase family protein [Brevundimonas sp.]|uniref:alpha/beta hydrolase family protein n=1 Tax=Brevundimonas sp. TaxID=1871086 RepID=UPI00391D8B5F